jgi:hypothetical protein
MLRTTHIGSHSISASLKIRGHYDPHVAEADKSDTASHGLTVIRSGRRASGAGSRIAYPVGTRLVCIFEHRISSASAQALRSRARRPFDLGLLAS